MYELRLFAEFHFNEKYLFDISWSLFNKQYFSICDAIVFFYATSRLIIIPKYMGINVANKFAFKLFHLYNNVRTAMHLISKTNHVT